MPDLGVTLVELLAYVGDYLSYYQDAVATEAYLDTARLRISVRRHARLVDYAMHEGCNARAWVCVEVGRPLEIEADQDAFLAPRRELTGAVALLDADVDCERGRDLRAASARTRSASSRPTTRSACLHLGRPRMLPARPARRARRSSTNARRRKSAAAARVRRSWRLPRRRGRRARLRGGGADFRGNHRADDRQRPPTRTRPTVKPCG